MRRNRCAALFGIAAIAGVAACASSGATERPGPYGGPERRGGLRPDSLAQDTLPLEMRTPKLKEGPLIQWGPLPPGEPHAERERSYDLVHQTTHVRLDWDRHAVVGRTTIRFTTLQAPVRSLTLDAEAMKIDRVTAGRTTLASNYDGHTLTILLPTPLEPGDTTELTIAYEAVRPGRGAYFIDRVHYFWTQGETDYTRYWVPTYDYPNDKETWEFYLTVPRGQEALSNGRLVSVDTTRDGTVWHWSLEHPASTYLMTAAIGDYTIIRDRWKDVPVEYWVYPDSVEAGRRGFGMTPDAMDIYSRKTGVTYPWSKYAQVVAPDYIFGGMENVTATTQLDDGILHPAWAEPQDWSGGLVAHELAHQWYGDLLTTRDWANVWLNEGFATFMEQIFREEYRGEADGALDRLQAQEQVIAADRRARRPLVYDRWTADPFDLFFSGHIYPKGATVLQMLRHELGDSVFWAAMHRYTSGHAYGSVVSADLQRAFEEQTGRSFDAFFKSWVYGAGFPAFQVRYDWDEISSTLVLAAKEVQPRDSLTGFFDADVDVVVRTDSGTVRDKVRVRGGAGRYAVRLPAPPQSIEWDAGGWLLDITDFPRPTTMLAHQAEHAEDVIGRIDAVQLLAERTGQSAAVDAVAKAARSDPFWGVRARAATALRTFSEDSTAPAARAALLAASRDRDARVREAAARSLGSFAGDDVAVGLAELARADSSYYVRGTAVQALASAAPDRALPVIRDMLARDSWLDVLRSNAIMALSTAGAPDLWETLAGYIGPENERATREAAIQALLGHARGHEAELARMLEPLLADADHNVRIAVAHALGELGQPSSAAALEARRKAELESRVINAIDSALEKLSSHKRP